MGKELLYKFISSFNFRGKRRIISPLKKIFLPKDHILHPHNFPADVRFFLNHAWELESDLLLFGCPSWFLDDSSFIKENYTGGTIVDVGANIGLYSLFFSKSLGAKVISFEPVQELFTRLQRNIILNYSPVIANAVALGGVSGEITLWMPTDLKLNSGHSSIAKDSSWLKDDVGSLPFTVPITTLDNYCEKNNIKDVGFIKIDVENAEMSVLKGALKTITKNSPIIFFEVNKIDEGDFERMFSDFSKLLPDYKVYFQDGRDKIPIEDAISSGRVYNGNWLAVKR